jgi:cytoskeletal protein RodZ
MPKKNDFGLSRSSRKKEQRLDRFLNWAIVIVVACILVVGGYLLVSILNTPDHPTAGSQKTKTTDVQSNKDNASKDKTNKKDDQTAKDDTTSDSATQDGDTSDSSNQSDDSTATDVQDGNYDTSGGGPDGPWHPIGTTQSEPHQTNYDMGSVDWNERVTAMSYATGIPADQMTVKWLGNGGGPDKSLGKVYSKQDPSKVYDVLMQWVTDKGWEPISVTVE